MNEFFHLKGMTLEDRKLYAITDRNNRIDALAKAVMADTLASIIAGVHPASKLDDPGERDDQNEYTFWAMLGETIVTLIQERNMDAADAVDVAKALSPLVYNKKNDEVSPRDRENALMRGSVDEKDITVTWNPGNDTECEVSE